MLNWLSKPFVWIVAFFTAGAEVTAEFYYRGKRFLKALWKRYRTPPQLRDVDFETYVANLSQCKTCALRELETCLACGCHLPTKARWMSEACPLEFWDNRTQIPARLEQLGRPAPPPSTGNDSS